MYGLRLNGKEKVSIVRGASYEFEATVFDLDTLKPLDLTDADTLKLFIQNADGTLLELAGAMVGTVVEGRVSFALSAAQSALLALTKREAKSTSYVRAEFELTTTGGDVSIATNDNMFDVSERLIATPA